MYDLQFEVSVKRKGCKDVEDFGDNDLPILLVHLDHFVKKVEEWKGYMPGIRPFYAVKCLNLPPILKVLHHLGVAFDCASKKELEDVIAIGVDPSSDIVYAHPIKMASHMTYAEKQGVRLTVFDNEEELYKMKKYYPNASLLLRIKAYNDPHAMAAKYGCEVSEAKNLLEKAMALGFDIKGVCFHVGSSNKNGDAFGEGLLKAKKVFEIGQDLGLHLSILDLGGGYPGDVPNDETTMEQVSRVIQANLHMFPEDGSLKLIAEPGTFFVALGVDFFVKVIGKKKGPNSDVVYQYYLNDGVFGTFSSLSVISADYKQTTTGESLYQSKLWGPTLDGLDLVVDKCQLPELDEGDWLCFHGKGAYSLETFSAFNGMPKPRILYTGSKENIAMLREVTGENVIEINQEASQKNGIQ